MLLAAVAARGGSSSAMWRRVRGKFACGQFGSGQVRASGGIVGRVHATSRERCVLGALRRMGGARRPNTQSRCREIFYGGREGSGVTSRNKLMPTGSCFLTMEVRRNAAFASVCFRKAANAAPHAAASI